MENNRMQFFINKIYYLVIVIIIFSITFGCATTTNTNEDSNDHPKLILSKNKIDEIKIFINGEGAIDYAEIVKYVKWRMDSTTPAEIGSTYYDTEIVLPIVLVAAITKDTDIINYAKNCCIEMSRINQKIDNDQNRILLLSMSISYDWLYQYFSIQERINITDSIIFYINKLWPVYVDNPKYSGGHSRFGSIALLAGIISTFNESNNFDSKSKLEILKNQWVSGYNPFQEYVANGGAYYMGVEYGAGYTSLWPYMFGERMGYDWLQVGWIKDLSAWYLYALRGDNTFIKMGDCEESSIGQFLAPIMSYSVYRYDDQFAEFFYQKYFNNLWGPYRIWRIIYPNYNIKMLPPDNNLPYGKHFVGSGIVIAKDSWDDNSAVLSFKSTKYYTLNHHHKDQNHFELSFKGSLLIDSGYYDYYGSSHWLNYYTRSIAHNTLVVYDPNEVYELNENLSNDGGQKFPKENGIPIGQEPNSLQDLLTDKYRFVGITNFGSNNGNTWVRGDATRAYSDNKIAKYVRDIVVVNRPIGRDHPVVLVYDTVDLKKLLTPKILFHTNEMPQISLDNGFKVINSGGGIVYGKIFSTEKIKIELVGGNGREWLVNGQNYPPINARTDTGVDVGAWRIEVGTQDNVYGVRYITVLSLDYLKKPLGEMEVFSVINNDFVGAVVGKSMILIYTGSSEKSEYVFNGEKYNIVEKIIIAGMDKGNYKYYINGRVFNSNNISVEIINNI